MITSAQDLAGTTKGVQVVPAPSTASATVRSITQRLQSGNFADRFNPEQLAALCAVARPAVPIYVGVATAVAAQRAGRLGLPLFADSTMNPDELREMLAAYDAAREAAGMPAPATHALQRDVFVTDDPDRDWAMLFPELRYMRRQYGAWSFPQAVGEDVAGYRERLEADIEAKLKNLIFGPALEVDGRLHEFEALGFGLIVCRSQFGNLPRPALHRAMEGLGRLAR